MRSARPRCPVSRVLAPRGGCVAARGTHLHLGLSVISLCCTTAPSCTSTGWPGSGQHAVPRPACGGKPGDSSTCLLTRRLCTTSTTQASTCAASSKRLRLHAKGSLARFGKPGGGHERRAYSYPGRLGLFMYFYYGWPNIPACVRTSRAHMTLLTCQSPLLCWYIDACNFCARRR